MADSELIIEIDGDSRKFEKKLNDVGKSAKTSVKKIEAETKNFEKTLKDVGDTAKSSFEKIDVETKNFKKDLKNLGNTAKTSLKLITVGFATVSAGIASAIVVGSDFEQQMKNVQAISGATGEEFELLSKKAREMGEKTAFSASEAGQAFQYMAMAGWDTASMIDGISGVMNLAAASGEELGRVSDIVTDALTAFGLRAKDSAHFADVLAMSASKSNTNVGLMGYSFQYVAPLAGALKFNIEDVAVALGVLANSGIKGEKSGTALRAIFTRLVAPPKTAAAAIDRLNLAVKNTDGSMRPLNDIILDLRKSFKNLSDAEKTEVASMLAGQEAISGLLALVNTSDEDFNKLASAINNADGEAQRMADTMLDSSVGAWKIFKSAVQETSLVIYDSLKKPLKEAIQDGTKSINLLNEELRKNLQPALSSVGESLGVLFSSFSNFLAEIVPQLIEAFAVILENIDSIGIAFSIFAGSVLGFKGAVIFLSLGKAVIYARNAMIALNVAMAANPIGALVKVLMVLVGAFAAVYTASDEFKFKILTTWKEITYTINSTLREWAKIGGDWLKANKLDWLIDIEVSGDLETPTEYAKRLKSELGLTENAADKVKKQIQDINNEVENLGENAGNFKIGEYRSDKEFELPGFGGFDEDDEKKKKNKDKKERLLYTEDYLNQLAKDANDLEKKSKSTLNPVAGRIGRDFSTAIREAIQGDFESTEDAIRSIGSNLMYSLADEMLNNAMGYLSNSLSQIGNFIISGFKSIFGIASPSKVFKYIGFENMRGLAIGFSENQGLVDNATAGVAEKVTAGLEDINPTISPNFNLQAVKEMFNIGNFTQPQLAGAAAGGSNNVVVNINSEFHLTGGGAGANSQSVTADDLNAFQKEISKSIENITLNVIQKNMRSGGILSR